MARLLSCLPCANTGERPPLIRTGDTKARLHQKARSQDNPKYLKRASVPDDRVGWDVAWQEYNPTKWEDAKLKTASWADPVNMTPQDLHKKMSHEGKIIISEGLPQNPRGRTGMQGRGLLGKWGPNHCADPIVTRFNPTTSILQMVAIQRKDTKQWAIPGGMVDPGENVSQTVRREFEEEAGNIADPETKQIFNNLLKTLFSGGRKVYSGYVDDPRNTDNAWMETVALNFHCNSELGAMLPLEAGDDAAKVMWLDCDEKDEKFKHLYADQRVWVNAVVNLRGPQQKK